MESEPVKEAPRARNYKFRANAMCTPERPSFTGVCDVYEGDEFFMTIGTVTKVVNGVPVLMERGIPPWADVIDEYPLVVAPKPLRKSAPGAAPVATSRQQAAVTGAKKL